MIKYRLICKNCDFSFDSWFASSKEFEKLRKKNFLSCQNCNSNQVEKTLMAPKLLNKKTKDDYQISSSKNNFINKKIKEYQKFIKENFEDVGNNFAYEARSIHYDNKKKHKGIYGKASKAEINELKDEGIEAEIIPWVDEKKN